MIFPRDKGVGDGTSVPHHVYKFTVGECFRQEPTLRKMPGHSRRLRFQNNTFAKLNLLTNLHFKANMMCLFAVHGFPGSLEMVPEIIDIS
jgi:hypothetical protein